ncbi:MAG: MFS transporter [Flavobacterium sp.]
MSQNVFRTWMPDWGIKVVLLFCMLHSMVLLGLYTSNLTYATSFLDVESEDLQYALSITYGTFLATILIESRIFKYFPPRNYFIAIYVLAAFTFIISAYTHHFIPFLILRMAEGILMALPWIPMRILLLTRFKSKNATITVFSLTYGVLLVATPFIVNIAVWLLENYNWKYMSYGSAFFQFLCVSLVMITFNGNRFQKKIPLYQIDWASFILVLAAILSGSFVLVYGEKKYWFESEAICLATVLALLTSALFIARQLLVKRPCFNLSVFKYSNLRTGLLLFILFYISRATLSICHSTMAKVWNWEAVRVAQFQYINAFGNLIGILIAAILLSRTVGTKYIFIIGFSLMAAYHLWFTFLFVPDVSYVDILIPYLLQGISVGVLFVPLVLFTVSSVPHQLAPFSGTVGVSGRFWGSTIGFSIMQNAQVFLQQKHFTRFRQGIIPEDPQVQKQLSDYANQFSLNGFSADDASKLALKQLVANTTKQSILLSNMELFTAIEIGLVVLVILLAVNQHLKQTFDLFRNKNWGS